MGHLYDQLLKDIKVLIFRSSVYAFYHHIIVAQGVSCRQPAVRGQYPGDSNLATGYRRETSGSHNTSGISRYNLLSNDNDFNFLLCSSVGPGHCIYYKMSFYKLLFGGSST